MSKSNQKHFTRGGQIAFHNVRMLFQIHKALFHLYWMSALILFGGMVGYTIPKEMLMRVVNGEMAHILKWIGWKPRHAFFIDPRITALCFQQLIRCALDALLCSLTLAGLLSWYFVKKGRLQSQTQFVRGSQFEKASKVKRQIMKNKAHSNLTIDGFPLVKDSEVQHLLVHGTVGTGKSQLIMKVMDNLRSRGDRVIVYDKGCALIPHYYDATQDVILNPFDKRCAAWDLWQEAPNARDLENMAESLLPAQGDSDPFWMNAARTVFTSAASKMREDKNHSLKRLLDLLLLSDFAELEQYLTGTPAATLMNSKIEKTALSIRSVITTYLKSMQSLIGIEGAPFSIRDTLLDEQQLGWIFISSNGEQHKSLKPLLSMWLAMASTTMLSLTPNPKRRIWFICDELPSLHKLPLLGETIAEVRKFGGCFLLGMQSFSQLEKIYGRSGAGELFDLLGTRFFFRSPSSDMARLVSRELGEEDIKESQENYSYGANTVRDGISLSNQRLVRPIVSYPEILELPNLTCFARLPGHYPVTKLELQYQKREDKAEPLVPRTLPTRIENASNDVDAPLLQKNSTHQKEKAHDYLD